MIDHSHKMANETYNLTKEALDVRGNNIITGFAIYSGKHWFRDFMDSGLIVIRNENGNSSSILFSDWYAIVYRSYGTI